MQDWNGTRFDAASPRGHVESHFLKLNDAEGRRALWLKATILRRLDEEPVAEAWAIAFDRERGHTAAKQVVPWATAKFSRETLDVAVADVRIERDRTFGSVGEIAWELAFEGGAAPFVLLPERLYADRTGNSKLVSPYPDLHFTGRYRARGETVEVDGWRGMQGHNWGRRHTHAYAWAHCNVWSGSDDLVVEGITARVKVGPFVAPPTSLLVATHGGVRHVFTLPQSLWRARGRVAARSWEIAANGARARVRARFWADTDDFVGLHYENPDGAMTYCLNSKIARGHVRLEAPGQPTVEAHTCAAALEIGTRDPAHGVAMVA